MAIAQRGLTLAEFLDLPAEEPALEYEYGRVIQKVSPKIHHSRIQKELLERLNRLAEPRKIASAFPELRATFGGHSYVPDIAVFRWARIPRDETGQLAADCFDPPDVAIEIASPEQSVNFLTRRCVWYVENGVGIALLVDPADESVLMFRPNQPPRALRGADRIDLTDVVPRFRLPVQELFASLRMN